MPRQGDRSSFPKDAFLTVPICRIAHQLLRCGKAKHICPFEGLSDTLNELSTASNGDMSLQIKLSTLNKDVKLAVIGPGTTKVRGPSCRERPNWILRFGLWASNTLDIRMFFPDRQWSFTSKTFLTDWRTTCKDLKRDGHWTTDQHDNRIIKLELVAAILLTMLSTARWR